MDDVLTESIQSYLLHLTTEPGVYRMLDANGHVLYVGKAFNLKKRVSSYFNPNVSAVKTRALVSQIASIDVTVTRSETEALLLESSLIKSLRPKYNVLMRDDKSYPFIHLSTQHAFPRIELMRAKKKPDHGLVFGPYPSSSAVRETLKTMQRLFKIRTCTDAEFSMRTRPCLQHQIQRCSAPCTGCISAHDYQQSIDHAVRFLQGKTHEIVDALATRMSDSVSRLAFEEAAVFRDQIKQLRLVQEQQGVVQSRGDLDVVVIDAGPGLACVQCVTIRAGEVMASPSFFPSVPKYSLDEADDQQLWQRVFTAFITSYYAESPERIPALLVTDRLVDDWSAIESILSEWRGKRCRIQSKPRGVNAKWLDFALHNLRRLVAEKAASTQVMLNRYQALLALMNRSEPISRMECFDISHTQGDCTVASCVVFDAGGPKKRDYRRFNIEGITPGDDYAAMEQAITRRFQRLMLENNLPDVLIIDGGKGQLAVAHRVFSNLGVLNVQLIGIAKGPDRKAGFERLILGNASDEITLPYDSPALQLLQHIRDEAHRFAITTHRKKRQKKSMSSSLESIAGIGEKRRQALLLRFGGLRELAKAPIAEIAKVPGINRDLAERIYQHFRKR